MTYELYCETYEDNEIVDNELVDVCGADSFEKCMEQFSRWNKSDLAENEKFCIKECLGGLYEPNYYYPF